MKTFEKKYLKKGSQLKPSSQSMIVCYNVHWFPIEAQQPNLLLTQCYRLQHVVLIYLDKNSQFHEGELEE